MSGSDVDDLLGFIDRCLPALNVSGVSRDALADILFDFLSLGGKLENVDERSVRPLLITLADRMRSRSECVGTVR